ncbi:MAG TPA: cadherin domain-containing protein [Thermoanaerobaculia bacterium]|nr:cadherin domain-containing protein [Thermoanaerobaculia bacterium]
MTLSGNILFSSLDGSAQDSDGLANGIFTVNGDLVLDGTINCNDDSSPAGSASACPIRITTSGDLTLRAGSGIFAENRRGSGAAGSILLTVGGNLTLRGPSGALPGAIVSSSRLSNAAKPAGSTTFSVQGDVTLEAGSIVAASTPNGSAGTIGITADGRVTVAGLVASGPSRQVLGTKLTGKILDDGKSAQSGGAILIRSHSSMGIQVETSGIIVSQGEAAGSQMVLLEGCGLEIRGLVASLLKGSGPSQVVLRSGKGILVDGRDLGVSGPASGRGGRVRADDMEGGSAGYMVDLFAQGDIQVLGPAPASSLAAVSSSPGTQTQRSGGVITAISLAGTLSAAGNAFEAGKSTAGNQGGIIDLKARGNVTLDGATLRAVGDFSTSASSRKGGRLSVRSFQGALSWTFGVGDVRPVGAGTPAATRGMINLTACAGIDTTGTQFPTVGSAILPFPTENNGVCSPAAPTLPSGEPPLQVCNRPPAADSQTVMTDEDTPVTITLTGSEPDGQPLTFTIVTPPAHGSLGPLTSPTATSVQVVYTPALDYNGPDAFTFQVDDGNGGTSTATVTLSVKPVNDAPKVDAATFTVNENAPNGTVVGTATFTDPDTGQAHTFAITAGNTAGAFAINPTTGQITVANSSALDFETTPSFSLTVQVTDDGSPALSGTAAVTIHIADTSEPPVVNPATFTVAENSPNGTAVGTVTFTDGDAGQTHTFSILGGNTGGTFAINPSTGTITVANSAALDFETTPAFSLTVQVTDSGSQSGTATITINVGNLNEAPVVHPGTFTLNENSPNGTAVGTVTFTDPDAGQAHTFAITGGNTGGAFAIDPTTGQITVANSAALDFETTPSFSLTVQVTDNGSPVLSGTATVTINLADISESPVVNPATFAVAENSPNGTVVGTVTFTDSDAGQTHIFSISGEVFAIDPSTGTITVANSAALDFETTPVFSLTVQVMDSGSQSGTATVTINVSNLNEAPVVHPATFAVNENSPIGTVLGTVTFTDPDGGQSHTFAITGGNTGGAFAIDPSTGQITVAGNIDYEVTPSFSLTVQVTDGGSPNLSGSATVTVGVNDINEAPIAGADSYNALGNTQLRVAGAPGTGLLATTASTGVLANDSDPDTNPAFKNLTLVAATGTSANGGDYSLASDGSFSYTPPAGFTGNDTFTYTLSDGDNTATGMVTVTVSNRVWYVRDIVDERNDAGGDGRSTDAFDSIAALNAATTNNGDIIFIFHGNTGTTPLTGGITLKDGQKLWGEGIGLTVAPFGTLVEAGSKPRINNTGGDAVSVPATAGNRQNIEIRGLDLQGSGNAVDVTASGANLVGVTISNNTVSGAGLEGIDLNAGSTGAFTAALNNNDIAATGNGFDARTSAATTLTLSFTNNVVVSNASGIVIDGSGGGTTTITGFANNGVSGNTVSTGIAITGARFDGTPGGTYDFVSGGATVVGASGNGVGGSGMVLTNVSGDLGFTDLDIFANGGAGLRVTGTGAFTGSAGMQIAVGSGVAIFEANGGPAVDVTNATINLQPTSIKSTNSPTTGLALNNVGGTFSAGSSSSISNITSAAGTAFQVGSSSATISYAGTINTTTGKGVDLTSNSSSTIGFTGTLTLSTGTNPAFTATGGGTVTSTDTASTLMTTMGTALNVANTNIGAGGLKFRSISAGTAVSGPANGIVLNATGSLGGLTVSGTGSAGSGGTIQKATGNAVSLNLTQNVSLNWMNVTNNLGSGVFGDDVTNFTIANSSVTNNGDTQNGTEAGLRFNKLLGTSAITNTTITGSSEDNVRLTPASGVLTNLAISGSTISACAAPVACNGFSLIATGTADVTLNVTGSTFANNKSSAFILNISNNSKAVANVSSSNFNDNTLGVDLSNALNADLTFDVTGNTFLRQNNNAINIISGTTATNAAQLQGKVSNNIIGNANMDSGSRDAFGIGIDADGDVDAVISVTNNTIQHTDFEGIFAESAFDDDADAETGKLDLTVTGNTVGAPDDNSAFPIGAIYGVRLESRRTTTLCLDISGNTAASTGGLERFRVRQRDTSTFKLERFGGAGNNDAVVAAFIAGQNAAGSTASATHATTYTGVAGGTCRKP